MPGVSIKATFRKVRFKCQRCGRCCHHKRPQEFGDLISQDQIDEFWEKSNLIYLTDEDIQTISRETGLDPSAFVDTLYDYDGKCVHVDEPSGTIVLDLPVLKSKADTTCVFYEDGCTIHPVRPGACRLFPFRVEEKSGQEGDIILNISYNESCPGIGCGHLADRGAIERLVCDHFIKRSGAVASEILDLAKKGMIRKGARICRSHPGRSRGERKTDPER